MKKKLTVTVGIPAYNEAVNIKKLLTAIITQQETCFDTKRVIVVSDHSTDKTVAQVQSVHDERIQLIKNRSRQGQIYCQNKIFSLADTDVVVIFEADTCPDTADYLNRLIQPLLNDSTIGLAQGLPRPLPAKTFTEKVLSAQVKAYQKYVGPRDTSPGQGGRAFTREVYSNLRWPKAIPEDRFALFWCRQKGIKTWLQKTAICLYRCPQHFSDYAIKRQKVKSGLMALGAYFSEDDINISHQKALLTRLTMIGYFFITNPIYFLFYAIFMLELRRRLQRLAFTDFWPVAQTTKNLAGNL